VFLLGLDQRRSHFESFVRP